MRKRLGQIILVILEYLPIAMTIGFSAYILLLSQTTTLSADDLLLWILSLLGLLATATLVERLGDIHRIEKFTEATYEHLLKHERKPPIDLIFSDRKSLSPLETRLQSAKEIIITGGSLFRLASEYLGYFERKARDGCLLKFLLVDPDSEAARLLAKYVVYEMNAPDIYRDQLRTSLSNLHRLKQRYPDQIELKVCDFVPPFSLLILDPKKEHGSIQVELYTLAVPTRDRPEFTVQAALERYWYNFFLNQFTQMWEQSKTLKSQMEPDVVNSR